MNSSLEDWMIVPAKGKGKIVGYALRGEVTDHPFQPDGKRVTTSRLVRIEGDAERAVCESRTYDLKYPNAQWMAEFKAAGHTLAEFGAGPARPLSEHSSVAARLKPLIGLRVMLTKDEGMPGDTGHTRSEAVGVLIRVESDGLVVDHGDGVGEMSYPSGSGWKVRRAQ